MFAGLQVFDWIFGVIFLVFVFTGIKNGFIGSIIQIVGIFLTFTFIGKFIPMMQNLLLDKFELNVTIANILSYILLIIAFAIVIKMIIFLTNSMLKLLQLNMINRIFGGLFGLVAGFGFILLFASLINLFPNSGISNKLNQKSKYYSSLEDIANKFSNNFKDKFDDSKNKIENTINKVNDEIDKVKELDDLVEDLQN